MKLIKVSSPNLSSTGKFSADVKTGAELNNAMKEHLKIEMNWSAMTMTVNDVRIPNGDTDLPDAPAYFVEIAVAENESGQEK